MSHEPLAISHQPSAISHQPLNAKRLCVPREPQFRRRRHVTDQRRGGDDDRTGEVAFAAEAHAILPVAVERGNGALPFFERIWSLAEARSAPRLPDLTADRSEHVGNG